MLDVGFGRAVRVLCGSWAVLVFEAVRAIVTAGLGDGARGLACGGRHGHGC